jgi:hypothetical protein
VSDQIMQDRQDGQDAPAKKRVPKGQRIPQATPAEVIPMVEALASFNGPASKTMVAGYMHLTAGGGAFKGKWATIGYYGFCEDGLARPLHPWAPAGVERPAGEHALQGRLQARRPKRQPGRRSTAGEARGGSGDVAAWGSGAPKRDPGSGQAVRRG